MECSAALHHNKKMTNYHIHLVFSERKMLERLERLEVKIVTRNMFYDEQDKHRRTKKIGKNNPKEAEIRADNAARQEWNDMQELMEKLQKQSQAMKSTQQELSLLKKQLSETTGFFKGKVRKSLEGKIEQAEKQEKRIHTDMEQMVTQAGYPDVQSFAKTYQKSEKLVREYNEELRAWENQTEQKKEPSSEPPKKASIREKLYRYQQESRQQPKQTAKKKSMDRER